MFLTCEVNELKTNIYNRYYLKLTEILHHKLKKKKYSNKTQWADLWPLELQLHVASFNLKKHIISAFVLS